MTYTRASVCSVPSDSPDDWRALQDLREMKDDALEKKYGLNLKTHINDFVVSMRAVSSCIAFLVITCAYVRMRIW